MATKKKAAKKKAAPKKKFKSAVTGKFVKPAEAAASPNTTYGVAGKKKKSLK